MARNVRRLIYLKAREIEEELLENKIRSKLVMMIIIIHINL